MHGPGLKITTDAVFFGAWAPLSGSGAVLDVGAGTGVLGFMAAQRFPKGYPLHFLEPNPLAASICRQNLAENVWVKEANLWENRIEDFQADRVYMDILCNPPFFVEAMPREDEALSQALHADKGLLERWIIACAAILAKDGRMHLMALPEARLQILKLSYKLGLYVLQEGFLHHSPAHPALRWVVSLGKDDTPSPRRPNWYIKNENGQFDEAYKGLVQAFYLRM